MSEAVAVDARHLRSKTGETHAKTKSLPTLAHLHQIRRKLGKSLVRGRGSVRRGNHRRAGRRENGQQRPPWCCAIFRFAGTFPRSCCCPVQLCAPAVQGHAVIQDSNTVHEAQVTHEFLRFENVWVVWVSWWSGFAQLLQQQLELGHALHGLASKK